MEQTLSVKTLVELRVAIKISQQEVADAVGMHLHDYGAIERTGMCDAPTSDRIARAILEMQKARLENARQAETVSELAKVRKASRISLALLASTTDMTIHDVWTAFRQKVGTAYPSVVVKLKKAIILINSDRLTTIRNAVDAILAAC